MSARKQKSTLTSSTSKCPTQSSARKVSDKSHNTTSTAARKLIEKNPGPNESIAITVDPTHSQKYMQHKLDMAYNKYIQNLALESILSEMHKEAERAYDEELVHYEEMHETVEHELKCKKLYITDVSTTIENGTKLNLLTSALEEICGYMDDSKTIEKLDVINENLQLICDNLNFKNITFVNSEENYIKLQNILQELSEILEEVNEGNNEDFHNLVDNIIKSRGLITKLRQNREKARHSQNKLNRLVLKTASLELSKQDEGKPCATRLRL